MELSLVLFDVLFHQIITMVLCHLKTVQHRHPPLPPKQTMMDTALHCIAAITRSALMMPISADEDVQHAV